MPDAPKPNPDQPDKPDKAARAPSSGKRPKRRAAAVSPEESHLQNHELAHHTSRRGGKKKTQLSQLNLTSMIDVIFLLLIYFVITANFVEDEGVLVAKLPSGTGEEAPEDLPPPNINIVLTSFNQTGVRIEVGAQTFGSFRDLTAHLIAIQDAPEKGRSGFAAPDSPVIIRPGGQVKWAHVVNAFNSSVRAAYTNVSFAQTGGEG